MSSIALLISFRSVKKHSGRHRQFLFLFDPFQKIFGQIKRYITGSIYGRSSIRFPHFIPIRQKTCSPWAILFLIGWHLKISSPLKLGGTIVCFMVFNATLNNISVISWRSVLLMEETGGNRENHRPVANHWQTLLHPDRDSNPQHQWW